MCSANALYTDESVKEINTYLNSRQCYIGTDAKFLLDCNTDTIKYILKGLTGKGL
jgi:hypothetical protein